jgi:adenylate kinase
MNETIERIAWIKGPGAQCQDQPRQLNQPWRVILLGPPGVGKGTQADLLSRRLGACHLSTGEVFRAASSIAPQERAPALASALELMHRGELVPDGVVLGIIRERIGCLHCGGGFLLDGFPRTTAQAEALEALLQKEGIALNAVVNYEMNLEEIVKRLAGRLTCAKCGTPFHLTGRPPRAPGVCDHCGGDLVQRDDDRPKAIRARLDAYQKTAQPLITFYRKRGLLISVDSSGSAENVCGATLTALNANGRKPDI